MKKYVYLFSEGNKDMKDLLGGKGANLAEMTNIGLPVPQGFTITTEACNKYYDDHEAIAEEIKEEIVNKVKQLEEITKKGFGDVNNPLLVSVRSGSRASMPGMMDTVLNLGLNDKVAVNFSKKLDNTRFVYDSYRRFIMMFADVVKGYDKSNFEKVLEAYKNERSYQSDLDLTAADMINITKEYKKIYQEIASEEFPQDPYEQLMETIQAVFRSWNNERAKVYRKLNDIPSSWGTAVNVQEMVYGNSGENSGTGVAFTRNPATGEDKLYGEYLINAQGEDVVAGIRTPQDISTLKDLMPSVYKQFHKNALILENHYKDMQDMEFTIENGKLFMLQTRNGKRTAQAAVKIAVDMVNEGLISKQEALMKVEPRQLEQLLHPTFETKALQNAQIIASGLAASPGCATGKIVFEAKMAKKLADANEKSILVRQETSPEDIEGMQSAEGVLTVRGGMTSHAAVVARGMGRCCVCGCESVVVNTSEKTLTTKDGQIFHEGDYISLDGTTGKVYKGEIAVQEVNISGDFETFMSWADETRRLEVHANADTPQDALIAKKFGAEGIGLCRTEHMFFAPNRILNFRKMIVSTSLEDRKKALANILPYQKEDFKELFKIMSPYPVVIRYLDPPFHEFLPKTTKEIEQLAQSLNITTKELVNRIDKLKEFNPMMGHRGCRLAITYPEIAIMQTIALIGAAIDVKKEGYEVKPEIMIPLIGDVNELKYLKDVIVKTADELITNADIKLSYKIGTMIEVPRAALCADEIAKEADFFSFGTNDLTQFTFGFSRDDATKYLNDYYDKKIYESDPFAKLDKKGVGKLIHLAAKQGKSTNNNLTLGICGEHAADASSVELLDKIGLDYISCSPYRIVCARLAAAQSSITANQSK